MVLFEITNGYCGESYVRCLAIAETPEQAIDLARPVFKAASDKRLTPYPANYWEQLTAVALTRINGKPWIGEVSDG